jgi:hypothetical protein
MQVVYDILGSMIIGGMILVMVLGFNANIIEGAGMQTMKTTVQGNMTTLSNVLEYDFRKMGYRVLSSDSAITYADTTMIVFKGDFDNNGSVDKMSYFLNNAKAPGTTNPRAKVLYREINGSSSSSINVGITRFRFTYYNSLGNQIAGNVVANPKTIRTIKVSVNMETREPYDTSYSGVYWERFIKPNNLR